MDFKTLAKNRFSCRTYKEIVPSDDLLKEVLDITRLAPSAANYQPWKFIVINEAPLLDEIKACYKKPWINSAPVVIAACGNHEVSWKREDGKDACDIDLAIAIDHLTLAATHKDLATCWICKFDSERAAELLHLPENWELIALIPIGYPDVTSDQERHERLRKPLEEIIEFNKFE
jgi:nitroreductase